jgi:L-lactate dehydrogenase complex protein LldG
VAGAVSTARAAILAAIRTATGDVPAAEAPAWPGPVAASTHPAPLERTALLDLLAERIADYQATVTRVPDLTAVPAAVAAILARHAATEIIVPADLPPSLRPEGVALRPDAPPLSDAELGGSDGVLTGCALAIADTGTIVLDHGGVGQGRRAVTLLPDLHVCVILGEQVVHTVPEAIEALGGTAAPITFVSGPSATSDIELRRVEGVHGPRRLEVVLVDA